MTKNDEKTALLDDANHELVIILANGEILYCHEKYCRYYSKWRLLQTSMLTPMILRVVYAT